MSKPLLVGITGGIGSGKSTLAKVIKAAGHPVYDADSRAKWLMNHDDQLIEEIKDQFGNQSYVDGKLNRSHLASTVFSNEAKLAQLNNLVHPRVRDDFNHFVQQHTNNPFIFKEAALLLEIGAQQSLDKMIVVSAREALRIERVSQRDPFRSKVELQQIINNQMSEDGKLKLANFIVSNEESDSLLDQWSAIEQELKKMIK